MAITMTARNGVHSTVTRVGTVTILSWSVTARRRSTITVTDARRIANSGCTVSAMAQFRWSNGYLMRGNRMLSLRCISITSNMRIILFFFFFVFILFFFFLILATFNVLIVFINIF